MTVSGFPAVGPGSPDFVDTAVLPDRKLSNSSTLACILCWFCRAELASSVYPLFNKLVFRAHLSV